jgi:dihydrolipoamide dehydrogenase
MSKQFDVVFIGAGPGGYIGAIRAAQLGFNVACIEGWKNPKGDMALGTPQRRLHPVSATAVVGERRTDRAQVRRHGITAGVKVDIGKMQARKDGIVGKMTKGTNSVSQNKITGLKGLASSFRGDTSPSKLPTVTRRNGDGEICRHVTGSKAPPARHRRQHQRMS